MLVLQLSDEVHGETGRRLPDLQCQGSVALLRGTTPVLFLIEESGYRDPRGEGF